jgi:hypothetical protein
MQSNVAMILCLLVCFARAKRPTNKDVTSGTFNKIKKRKIMKTMTCKQLGGACDKEFHANSFEEMAGLSKKHGMEMLQKGDQAHLNAMNEMKELMKTHNAMKDWFENKRKEFEALPED